MKPLTKLLPILAIFWGGVLNLYAQNKVSGQVTDSTGEGIPGVAVYVKGDRTDGTITDADGRYAISLSGSNPTLVFSCIGYEVLEIKPGSRSVVDVALKDDSEILDAVIVTGMTKTDKRLFTGAADNLAAGDVKLDGLADISRGLEGKSAGVSVQNVSGTFGTAPKIRVRGATSIYGSSKPLWVVDGVIMEDMVDIDTDDLSSGDATTLIASAIAGLNAEDIETFNILKDGSATSIYGARAMAGVIVITTKRGRAGVSRINYTGEFTLRDTPSYNEFNIMNSQDQMSVYNDMYNKGWLNMAELITDSESGVYGKMYKMIQAGEIANTDAGKAEYLRQAEYRNTDWFKILFRRNIMQTHSVSLTSGTEKSSYYASLSVMTDPGWYYQSKVNRYTANLNATYNILKSLNLNVIANASYRKQKAPGTLSSATNYVSGEVKRDFDINPYSYSLNTSRTLDPDEFYTRNYAPFNIVNELQNNYIDLSVVDTKFQAELTFTPLKGLDIALLGAVKYQASKQEHNITENSNQAQAYRAMEPTIVRDNNSYLYTDPDNQYAVPVSILDVGGVFERNDYSMLSYDFRLSATYNKTFRRNHIVNLYAGMSTNQIDRHTTWFRGWGLQYDMGLTPYYNYLVFKKGQEDSNNYYTVANTSYREVAFFFNGTYSYKGKYTVNGTFRYEGTNKMGRSRRARWMPTWNISGAWNIHEENFFDAVYPYMSNLSLKASYSLTADRGPSSVTNSLAVINSTTPWRPSTGDSETGLVVSDLENAQLTYEKKNELNIGVDAGFFGNRINLAVDWYKRNNYDLIGPVTTQGIGGIITKYGNVATMKSDGIEISLTTKNIQKGDFSWTTNLIYSHINNKVTKLETSTRAMSLISGTGFTMEGYPARSLFSFQFVGLDEQGIPVLINTEGNESSTTFNFQDRNEDNLKNNLVYSGTVDPTDLGSFGNIFKFRNWSMNVFITYSFGNVVRLDPVFSYRYTDLDAMPREFKNRWMVSGNEDITTIPAILSKRQHQLNSSYRYVYSAYNYSTERIAKGDFIRMKEISISYDFSRRLLAKTRISSLSLKLQATNLFLIYADKKLNGQDPEYYNTGGVASPVPRQFTLTLRIGL